MKTKKMSLATITGKLSRAEMKNIMAGSSSGCNAQACGGGGSGTCKTGVHGCYCSVQGGQC